MSIKNDIKELTENQIIDQETADRISTYYQSKKKSVNITTIISVVAAILVGAGVISIIAYNWDELPKFLRVIIGLIPWIASSFGCCYTLKHKAESKGWAEAMAILQTATFATSFAIVNQVFQVQMEEETFAAILLLVSLPFVFLLRSAALSLLLTAIGCMASFEAQPDTLNRLTTYIVLLADIAFLYNYYYRNSESFLCGLRIVALPIFWVCFFGIILARDLELDLWSDLTPCLFAIFASVAYTLYDWIHSCERIKSRGTILNFIFYLVFFPTILYFSHEGVDDYYTAESFSIPIIASIPVFVHTAWKLMKREKPQWQSWIGVAFAAIAIICGEHNYIISIFTLAIIAYIIYLSYQDYDLFKLNIGILSLFAWAFVILSDFNLAFYVYGFILILLGVALIVMNKYIMDKKKNNGVTEDK